MATPKICAMARPRGIDPDAEAHLGYRKGKQSGIWLVRKRNHHKGGNYKQAPVGVANDINDKPADGILSFEQAVRVAREIQLRVDMPCSPLLAENIDIG